MLGLSASASVLAETIRAVKWGTTVATNALLGYEGEPTLLVINAGFGDALRIGYQNRPDILAFEIQLPAFVYTRVLEVAGRIDAQARELIPLDEAVARAGLQAAYDADYRSTAIVLIHGYLDPGHERAVDDLARPIGFGQISVSHDVSPLIKRVAPGDTTVVGAYLTPILSRYVDRVAEALPGAPLFSMQSNGGLTTASLFRGKDSFISGPAGGVVCAVSTAAAGYHKINGFDMGETSTNVSHFAGAFD